MTKVFVEQPWLHQSVDNKLNYHTEIRNLNILIFIGNQLQVIQNIAIFVVNPKHD